MKLWLLIFFDAVFYSSEPQVCLNAWTTSQDCQWPTSGRTYVAEATRCTIRHKRQCWFFIPMHVRLQWSQLLPIGHSLGFCFTTLRGNQIYELHCPFPSLIRGLPVWSCALFILYVFSILICASVLHYNIAKVNEVTFLSKKGLL